VSDLVKKRCQGSIARTNSHADFSFLFLIAFFFIQAQILQDRDGCMIYLSIFLLDFFMHFFIFANVRQEYGSIGYVLQSHNQASFEEVEMGIYYSLNRSSRLLVLVILSFAQHLTPISSIKEKNARKDTVKNVLVHNNNSPSSTNELSNLRGYLAEKLVSDDW